MGGAVPGAAGAPGDWRRPELRPDVRDTSAEGEDRSPGCTGGGRGVCTGGVSQGASFVRRPAPRARSARGARRAGPHADALHCADPITAAARRLAGADGTAEGFSRRVLALPLPGRLRSEVAPLLAVMRQVTQQVGYSDERLATLTQTDARVRGLQSVPNIGPVTAPAFVAALDDAHRFGRAHEVKAYARGVRREWSAGETQRRGRITKAGSGRVRWLLAADPGGGVDAAAPRSAHSSTAAMGR